jgi:cytochrome c oxidase subunit 2
MTKGPAILIVLLLSVATALGGQGRSPHRIEIVAKRFFYDPGEITVRKGDQVILALRSVDVTHGLEIKELGVRTEIRKGRVTEVSFTAEKPGKFVGKCIHFCGSGHGSMILTVNVIE